jgi:type I restriction enzyme S subunit
LHAGIQVKEHKASIPFQRSVLAAEIAERMYPQITFGRVKFQKALALCEMHLGMDLDGHYKRDAAGPFDNRMMRSVSKQLQDQQWFQEVKREGGKGWQYEPMEKHGGHRKYFERYWGNKQDEFDNLIHLLSRMDSRQAEIVATLYSAWRDFLAEGKQPTDNELVTEVRTNWHDSKKAIEPETWHKAIDWMRKEGLVPDSKQG